MAFTTGQAEPKSNAPPGVNISLFQNQNILMEAVIHHMINKCTDIRSSENPRAGTTVNWNKLNHKSIDKDIYKCVGTYSCMYIYRCINRYQKKECWSEREVRHVMRFAL